jgi:four helix bundle protein
MRDAAVSIPSNIAEGQGRGSDREWCRFLYIARGSLAELETQLVFAERLTYISPESSARIGKRSEQVGRILNGLIRYVKARGG